MLKAHKQQEWIDLTRSELTTGSRGWATHLSGCGQQQYKRADTIILSATQSSSVLHLSAINPKAQHQLQHHSAKHHCETAMTLNCISERCTQPHKPMKRAGRHEHPQLQHSPPLRSDHSDIHIPQFMSLSSKPTRSLFSRGVLEASMCQIYRPDGVSMDLLLCSDGAWTTGTGMSQRVNA